MRMDQQRIDTIQSIPALLTLLETKRADTRTQRAQIDCYLERRARQYGIPLSGKFVLTPLCNLDCKMCYIHLNEKQMEKKICLSAEQWKQIMDEAIQAGMIQATLTGGESLLHPAFEELYQHLYSRGILVSVYTNGILLDEKMTAFFQEHPPKVIQITLYGSCESVYQAVTGHRRFQTAMDAIMRAKMRKLPLRIAITPNAFMGDDGENLVRLADELGVPYTINSGLLEPYEETGRRGAVLDASLEQYIRMQCLSALLRGQELRPLEEADLPERSPSRDEGRGIMCGAGRSGFCAAYDGTIMPCDSLTQCRQYPLHVGFAAAWKAVNDYAASYQRPMPCEVCRCHTVCGGCVVEKVSGSLNKGINQKVCERTKRQMAEGILSVP